MFPISIQSSLVIKYIMIKYGEERKKIEGPGSRGKMMIKKGANHQNPGKERVAISMLSKKIMQKKTGGRKSDNHNNNYRKKIGKRALKLLHL